MKLIRRITAIAITSITILSSITAVQASGNKVFEGLIAKDTMIRTLQVTNNNPNIYVTCDTATEMREESSSISKVTENLPKGYHLSVLGAEYGWVYVQDDDGIKGYVHSANVTFNNGKKPQNIDPLVAKGTEIATFSKNYLGIPYVWGGTSLTSGVDCSGFVYCIYKQYGITLNRSSRAMYSGNGVSVGKSELIPGDLLFFNTGGGGVSHVGMYIGNNQYIHAATTSVIISDLNSSYSQRTYVGAKRILA